MRHFLGAMLLAFAGAGLALVYMGAREMLRKLVARDRFQGATGVVLSIRRKTMASTNHGRYQRTTLSFPVIRFTTREGEAVTFTSEAGETGSGPRYATGTKLPVLYDPAGEFAPMLDSWSGVWFLPVMLLAGGLFLLLGAFMIALVAGDPILQG